MAEIYERGFGLPGTPEYVLARAGLVRVVADGVYACDKRTRLFRKHPMPPLEQVVPALVAVAFVCNAQLGGAIDVPQEAVKAVERLMEIGLAHDVGIHAVFEAIGEVIADVAEECRDRRSPSTLCLYWSGVASSNSPPPSAGRPGFMSGGGRG